MRSLKSLVFHCIAAGLVTVIAAVADSRASDPVPQFNRDVRPILSSVCFKCHGPDEAHRGGDIRLDTEEGIAHAFGGGLDESEAWKRLTATDPGLVMPPPDSPIELEAGQREILRRWIEAGAKWQGHWSFIAPRKPAVPDVRDAGRIRNAIDSFIAARLKDDGLSLSDEADRERLLRRVTFDLTGLPPTLEEIDAFLAESKTDPDGAYERAVDRLLASQHFGERMALAWMDAARYGDSSVFHADGPRDMWPWRDWVIKAYNDNKPFDEFTVEQLAGDLIPQSTTEQKIATGFNRNNATTDEGGVIAEEFRVEYAVDRVKTTSMIWMGLSLECAQCHNHKYDPITMDDYYRVFAYFNQASDPGMQTRSGNQAPLVDVFDPQRLSQAAILKQDLPPIEERLVARKDAAEPDFLTWLEKTSADVDADSLLPGGGVLHLPLDESLTDLLDEKREASIKGKTQWADGRFGKAFQLDGSNWIDLGNAADFTHTDAFSYGCWLKPNGAGNGTVIAKMDDGNAYRGFDMLFSNGRLAVHIINTWPTNAIKVNTKDGLKKDEWQHVFVVYDGSSKASGLKIYFDGKLQEWTIEQDRLSDTIRSKVPLYLGRRSTSAPFNGLLDEVRIYDRALTDVEVQALAGSDPIRPLLALKPDERTAEQTQALRTHYLTSVDVEYQQTAKELKDLKARISEHEKPISTVMVMQDVPNMRQTFVLDRGDYASPDKDRAVNPGVLSMLPPPAAEAPQNRLGLAQWIVQDDHPLTARVTVNRYWAMLFGTGIVKTLEDFGSQGEWPSHPELLDWLAVDFVDSGWDIKRMLKQMVLSSTYRQTVRITPELLEHDPENRLLARGPRFRLQGEFIRDNALAASGLLVNRIGGPSVKPYQPPGLWNEVSLSGERFTQDTGENLYRRSMYTYWKRSAPAPSLTIFDAPTREKCVLRRSRTNTPLQALVTLNDVQFVEAARMLAERAMKHGGETIDDRIEYAYRLATGVRPKSVIRELLKATYQDERSHFAEDAERAKKLISSGESPRDESLDAADHAALTIVTSMILNLDETLTRG
jgi:hypothetical protein